MKVLFLFAALPLLAAEPPGFQVWKSTDLQAQAKKIQSATGAEDLVHWDNHFAALVKRDEKNGPVEVHENWTDVYFILSGEGTAEVGGELVNPKTTAPGEIRGTAIRGATSKRIETGDIVHILAKMPHHVVAKPGATLTYFLIKVPAK